MFTKLRQDLVRHYAVMAMNPHTVEQARWRARELEKDSSGLWIGIADEIAAKIIELKGKEDDTR
jgi:hypothetical protein